MKKRFILFSFLATAVFLVQPFASQGQQTIKITDPYEHFRQAKKFFDANNFTAAQEEFRFYLKLLQGQNELLISERTTVEYYIAICSIYSMRPEAEIQAVKFIADHPESPYTAKLVTEIGVFYYETGDWARAIKYLSESSQTNLEHKYYLAVSYYKSAQYKEALNLFNILKYETEEEFALPSAYYAGVMNFHAEKYETAIEDFKIAVADPKYATEAPVWISSAYMKMNRYNDLIGYVQPVLQDSSYKQSSGNLASIIAELQFQKQDYENAAKSYAVVFEKSASLMNRERTYKYAFSLYKSKRYDDALRMLAKPGRLADSLDQEIAKTRALILLDQSNWETAFQALQEVAAMPYNPDLADEAMLMSFSLLQKKQQWGKLLSEIKNYQKRFPKNKHAELLVSYALGALIKEGNLSAIEDFMLNFPVGKVKFQELYQSTCYEIANKAYDKRDDRKASTYFKKSLDFPVNREMAWYARYAMAEMAARINRNSDAIKLYIPLLAETSLPNGSRELSQRIRLSLAYSFAYITFYDRSLQYFEEYMANKLPGQRSVEDLKNLAEISIANGNLVGGMKLFDEAIGQNTPQTAELIDRKFAIYNGLRKYKEAAAVYQEYLAKFPNLTTADQVFYQMNVALAKLQKSENYAQVISNASQFIQQKSPANPYFAPVLLLRAQAYQNTNQWFLALDDYTMIVRKYTTDSSAKEAIIGANDLLRKASRFAEVLELNRIYANQHGEDPTMADQWFDICVEMFRQEKYKLLVPELVRFIQEHPKYDQLDEINYMLGVSTYHTKDLTNALVYLKRSQQSSTFANKSQWMIALVHEQQKNLDLAVNQLVDLKANISYQDTLTQHVQDKLKQIYLHQQKFDALSKLWLDVDPADSTRRSQWALEIGQNAFDMQSYPLALSWFEKSVTFDADEVGAKAAIAYAKVKALQKDWSGSNAWLTSQFIQDGSRYFHLSDAIVGLAFIQMAENFVQLKNVPQAKAILQSILANSSDDAVKVIAKKKMDEIQ